MLEAKKQKQQYNNKIKNICNFKHTKQQKITNEKGIYFSWARSTICRNG
jgi:hypothetical protein